ncbi:DUF885 domain-containing protein [Ramlibacter sp. PS4R-6]|uniref:DUF885 domain-containing protein n=1 Tax=Ramlibacter sp. PS4R-6 TaxID=3133438 RepID=UPI00309AE036
MTNFLLTRRTFNTQLAAAALTTALPAAAASGPAAQVARLADAYMDAYWRLFPLDATENTGDAVYEGLFAVDIAPAAREQQRALYRRTLAQLEAIPRAALEGQAALTWDVLKFDAQDKLARLAYPSHLVPVGHIDALPVKLSQWASGDAAQPLATAQNQAHFLVRLKGIPAWIDQAIANMKEGMARGFTLPRPLVERTLPQLAELLPADVAQSPFLAASRKFADARMAAAYRRVVEREVTPAVARLRDFMAGPYLAAARTTAGLAHVKGGREWYATLVRSSTTSSASAAELHELGLREVERIRAEMAALRARFDFKGELDEFIQWVGKLPANRPFRSEDEVIAAYEAINERVKARLPRLFERSPKAALQIRPIEPIRRATASDNYVPPSVDGARPGVFYVVVQEPGDYQRMSMNALFLHEGQPGHHYQMALQRELGASKFLQSTWYDAFGEGWALYAESLGHDLGVYDEPLALMGRLQMELHRALRLVVDTGLHDKGWSREETMAFLRSKEGSTEEFARRATERYMAWPGQALAYKAGELKIIQLRERARAALGGRFDIRAFHARALEGGCVPLALLEARIDAWIAAQRSNG